MRDFLNKFKWVISVRYRTGFLQDPGILCDIEQPNLADSGSPQRPNFFTYERYPLGLFYGTKDVYMGHQ